MLRQRHVPLLSGIPRLIFLTAPLAFLLLHAYIIYAQALMIALFVLPHMIHASLTNSRIQGDYATLSGVKSTRNGAGVVYRTTDAGGAD